jgi:hypothetical protein
MAVVDALIRKLLELVAIAAKAVRSEREKGSKSFTKSEGYGVTFSSRAYRT